MYKKKMYCRWFTLFGQVHLRSLYLVHRTVVLLVLSAIVKESTLEYIFFLSQNLCATHIDAIAKWLSCNGEVWGIGPTLVFASAAALFLHHELTTSLNVVGDQAPVSALEKTLVTSMVAGMLALMVHLWVCSMRFFQYYLDSVIKDSPNMLLELTTAGIFGSQSEVLPLSTLTRFIKLQQPQIHITICWFLALCYADYVRKNFCQRFNLPYLEQWQAELHARASRSIGSTVARVNSFVGAVHRRLRGYTPQQMTPTTNNERRERQTKQTAPVRTPTQIPRSLSTSSVVKRIGIKKYELESGAFFKASLVR